jgi:Mlc titration factor MtfA (ptsG expression regulator)
MNEIILLIIALLFIGAIRLLFSKKRIATETSIDVPDKWKTFLANHVLFYKKLDSEQKARFEHDVFQFLSTTKITGVNVEVTLEDRLLVASSAVIPLFGFPQWSYSFLDEVILYPASFDRNFELNNPLEIITGMVGNGPMEGKMILSKPSLHAGFSIGNDKKNVGIHEFIHLFDKEDGLIDGIPPGYDSEAVTLPWVSLIGDKTKEIVANRSDINNYAATNRQEFFAVAGEYFFERPHLLRKKHPKLYQALSEVFNQDLASTPKHQPITREIGRNDPCPCGSGVKYKKCCIG